DGNLEKLHNIFRAAGAHLYVVSPRFCALAAAQSAPKSLSGAQQVDHFQRQGALARFRCFSLSSAFRDRPCGGSRTYTDLNGAQTRPTLAPMAATAPSKTTGKISHLLMSSS